MDYLLVTKFKLDIKSDRTQIFNLKYNETIRKLVVNPVSFGSTDIGVGTTFINNNNQ